MPLTLVNLRPNQRNKTKPQIEPDGGKAQGRSRQIGAVVAQFAEAATERPHRCFAQAAPLAFGQNGEPVDPAESGPLEVVLEPGCARGQEGPFIRKVGGSGPFFALTSLSLSSFP